MTQREQLNECLAAIKNGDASKFYELNQLAFGPLMSVAKRYLNNHSYAESVVQDMLCSIFLYADHYDPKRDAYAYLWQIVKRKAYDCNERHKREKWISIDEIPIGGMFDPSERVVAKIDAERALQTLRTTDRLIVQWLKAGETQEEIGRRLGISKSAVNQRLNKIKKKLFEYLK